MTFDNTADGYRLPTEAEWEYIAREAGNSTTIYSGSNTIGDVAWYSDNSGSKTHEVKTDKVTGTDSANALGIYDISGNALEWCWDDWFGSFSDSTGASGASSGDIRVRRGGCWYFKASSCSVACRNGTNPNSRSYIDGFRLVRFAQ